ncbi:MAG: primosomal protein N' [Desulfobacteraceae bacterium]
MHRPSQQGDNPLQQLMDVAVPLPIHHAFTYRIPRHLRGAIQPGMRVLVPFGRRRLTGYALGMPQRLPEVETVKEIADVLDETPLFPESMVGFFRWVADYYLHPLGEVIQTALPGGLSPAERPLYRLSDSGRKALADHRVDEAARRMLETMAGPASKYAQICKRIEWGVPRSKLNTWVARGWLVRTVALTGHHTRPKMQRFAVSTSFDRHKVRLSPQRKKILSILDAEGGMFIAQLKSRIPTSGPLVRAMAKDGQVRIMERAVYRDPLGAPIDPDRPPELTAEQRNAVDRIGPTLGKAFKTFLLSGVTGSGKTEVYLHLAAEAFRKRMAVLVLVPEIALISQMERAFRARFGDRIALLHSGLSNGERFDQYRRIANGELKIAIGARSAIFAPFERLGLIIVDEEHDDSYKQEGALRYHARDLAVVRAKMNRSVAIVGSATPSLESAYNAQLGKYEQIDLHERIDNRMLPDIDVQDLTLVKEEQGLRRFISPALIEAMDHTLSRREQVLLFLNRRGFANFMVCADCGQTLRCDRCDISLTFHKQINAYKCHYCGFHRKAGSCCGRCGSSRIKRLGLGTEKVESKIQSLFPKARVERMDRDTTRRKGAIVRILKALRNREIDILVGTQMVAKGHDYPHITLVGIICADLSLGMPDFRAGERTFQLLAQVAGRAGRGTTPGKVILQTYNPQHFSIQSARVQDFGSFFRQEMKFRQTLGYPPYTRMIQVRVQGKDKGMTAAHAKQLGRRCNDLQRSGGIYAQVQLLGPLEAPLPRIADYHRWQLLLKSPQVMPLHSLAQALLMGDDARSHPQGIAVAIDVDPLFVM